MPAGGENLLAVDDVLVTISCGRSAQCCKVGAGFRFGVADREVHFTGEDRGQEFLLLLLAAVLLQSRTDCLQRHRRQWDIRPHSLVDKNLLLDFTEPTSAVLHRPANAEPTVLAHTTDDLTIGRAMALHTHDLGLLGRDQRREVASKFSLQCALTVGQIDEHRAPTRSSRCEAPPSRRAKSFAVE